MRERQQQLERLARQPPERSPCPHAIGQQGQRNQRHRSQRCQRDRHHIGQRAIDPRPVKVEQPNRHQRQFDHHPGQQQPHHLPQSFGPPGLLTRGIEGPHRCRAMQRDNRDHRGKAHLERWPDQRLGPEQQHHKGRDRDHPHRERLAPDRQRRQHQQRSDARADRRDGSSGQQGIGDPGQGSGPRGHQRQADPQRQPRDQRQQPQRQHIASRHHRADVQPADRQQVG